MVNNQRDGFALVAVLVFCLILVPVIASFAQASRISAHSTQAKIQVSKVLFLLDGLADVVASKLAFDANFIAKTGAGLVCKTDGLIVAFSMQDHDGKIDLNNAGTDLLRVGFQAAGFSPDEARLLQEYVEASRSGGSLSQELRALPGLPGLKGMAFERVEEIDDVTQALKLQLRDLDTFFTVYKRNGNLEMASADGALRTSLQSGDNVEGVFDSENGTFDYVDVSALTRLPGNQMFGLRKTYRRMDQIGGIQEISRRELSGFDFPALGTRESYPDCIDLLTDGNGVVADG